jgi:hypothetical protein
MAHYAFLDENNIVTEVIVGKDETELIDGLTPEEWYGNYKGQRCIRTSYNHSIRKNFAGIGFKYDENCDAFISPKPYSSWTLNEDTARWEAPIPCPADEHIYEWVEPLQQWVQVL